MISRKRRRKKREGQKGGREGEGEEWLLLFLGSFLDEGEGRTKDGGK